MAEDKKLSTPANVKEREAFERFAEELVGDGSVLMVLNPKELS